MSTMSDVGGLSPKTNDRPVFLPSIKRDAKIYEMSPKTFPGAFLFVPTCEISGVASQCTLCAGHSKIKPIFIIYIIQCLTKDRRQRS